MTHSGILTSLLSGLVMSVAATCLPANAGTSDPDQQLRAAVEAKLATDVPQVVQRIQVEVKDGIVTLRGSAMTSAYMLRAIKAAQGTNGVTKVQNRLGLE